MARGTSSVRTQESPEIAMVCSSITDVMIGYPAPLTGEFEQVIMIAVGIEEMAGSD